RPRQDDDEEDREVDGREQHLARSVWERRAGTRQQVPVTPTRPPVARILAMQETDTVPSGGRLPVSPDGPDPLRGWIEVLHGLYPPAHAEGWDQVGLHVGDPDHDVVSGVLVSLDVTVGVLEEAADRGA